MKNKIKRYRWIVCFSLAMIFLSPAIGKGEDEIVYDSHGKRDPFVPLVTLTTRQVVGLIGIESLDEIIINGIVYDPKNGSMVIANGTVLKEGEESGSVKVLEIKPNGALFAINGVPGFKQTYEE